MLPLRIFVYNRYKRRHHARTLPLQSWAQSKTKIIACFLCLEFFVPLENLSFGDDTIAGEGLQILTYARHLSPMIMSSEGSLACHTYCDTGHPFCTGHLRGPVILTPNAEGLSAEISLPVLTN